MKFHALIGTMKKRAVVLAPLQGPCLSSRTGAGIRTTELALALLLLLTGCAATEKPQLMTEPGISLASYKEFAVPPATNQTGQAFDFDFAGTFTQDLKSALQTKGYTLIEGEAASPDTLLVQCSFIAYAPGRAFQRWLLPGVGETQATVRTTLVDKKSGQPVGDLVTTKVVAGGFLGRLGGYNSVLGSVADDVATAIDKKIKG